MRAFLVAVAELAAIALIAVGIGVEVGFGWGLVVGGVGGLGEAIAAQMPGDG